MGSPQYQLFVDNFLFTATHSDNDHGPREVITPDLYIFFLKDNSAGERIGLVEYYSIIS